MAVETVFLNGDFLPKHEAAVSPDDRAFVFGDGVYEVIRAYDGQFFQMELHIERMQNGLDALSIDACAAAYAPASADLLQRNGLGNANALVYTQITRGAALRLHRFPPSGTPPTVFASASAFAGKGDPGGVKIITAPDIRWHRCDIKSLNLLPNCMAAQRAYEAGAFEALLIRDGVALECSATSFFAVFNGEVRTAPATNYILPSITRNAAIGVCADRKSTRLNSSHTDISRMPSSA